MPHERARRRAGEPGSSTSVLSALSDHGWALLHEARWPEHAHTRIDHVAVGPQGIFVVTVLRGHNAVSMFEGVLVLGGRRRDSALSEAQDAADVVISSLSVPWSNQVTPVLCLDADRPVERWIDGILVCSRINIATVLRSMPGLLHQLQVADVADYLEATVQHGSARMPGPEHRREPNRWLRAAIVVALAAALGLAGTQLGPQVVDLFSGSWQELSSPEAGR